METKKTIMSNDSLYGDYELIPLPVKAVEQRIGYFNRRIGELMIVHYMNRDNELINKYIKAREFWKEIKSKHCIGGDDELGI